VIEVEAAFKVEPGQGQRLSAGRVTAAGARMALLLAALRRLPHHYSEPLPSPFLHSSARLLRDLPRLRARVRNRLRSFIVPRVEPLRESAISGLAISQLSRMQDDIDKYAKKARVPLHPKIPFRDLSAKQPNGCSRASRVG